MASGTQNFQPATMVVKHKEAHVWEDRGSEDGDDVEAVSTKETNFKVEPFEEIVKKAAYIEHQCLYYTSNS